MDNDAGPPRKRCQYCRGRFTREEVGSHELVCVDNPQTVEAAVEDLDGPVEPVEDLGVHICSHCGLDFTLEKITAHEDNCEENPENIYSKCKAFKLLEAVETASDLSEFTAWINNPMFQRQALYDVLIQGLIGVGLTSGSRCMIVVLGKTGSGKSALIESLTGGGFLVTPDLNNDTHDNFRRLRTVSKNYTFIDSSGDVKNILKGISLADCVLYVIDSSLQFDDAYAFDDYLEHGLLAVSMGVKHLICCLNKMDLVSYSEEVFLKLKDDVTSYLESIGYDVLRVPFVPVSAYLNENTIDNAVNLSWYKDTTLLGELERLDHYSKVSKEVRVVVDSASEEGLITGRVHSGKLESGYKLRFSPGWLLAEVVAMNVNSMRVDVVWPGEAVNLNMMGSLEMIERGSVATYHHMEERLYVAGRIIVKMRVLENETKIARGSSGYLCLCHKAEFNALVSEIRDIVDKCNRIRLTEADISAGDTAVFVLIPLQQVVVENITEHPSMGRITFCDVYKKVLAVGVIMHVIAREGSSSSVEING